MFKAFSLAATSSLRGLPLLRLGGSGAALTSLTCLPVYILYGGVGFFFRSRGDGYGSLFVTEELSCALFRLIGVRCRCPTFFSIFCFSTCASAIAMACSRRSCERAPACWDFWTNPSSRPEQSASARLPVFVLRSTIVNFCHTVLPIIFIEF